MRYYNLRWSALLLVLSLLCLPVAAAGINETVDEERDVPFSMLAWLEEIGDLARDLFERLLEPSRGNGGGNGNGNAAPLPPLDDLGTAIDPNGRDPL